MTPAVPASDLQADVEAVQRLSVVPTILDVVCQMTGMGFAAIARVTDQRWIACSVRDDINFALGPGMERADRDDPLQRDQGTPRAGGH
jgi:hypothetical protein